MVGDGIWTRKERSSDRNGTNGLSSEPMAIAFWTCPSVVLEAPFLRNAMTGWSLVELTTRSAKLSCRVVASLSSFSGRGKSTPFSQLVTACPVTSSTIASSFCVHPRACSACFKLSLWITLCIASGLCSNKHGESSLIKHRLRPSDWLRTSAAARDRLYGLRGECPVLTCIQRWSSRHTEWLHAWWRLPANRRGSASRLNRSGTGIFS